MHFSGGQCNGLWNKMQNVIFKTLIRKTEKPFWLCFFGMETSLVFLGKTKKMNQKKKKGEQK